jgi:hypothetical protein
LIVSPYFRPSVPANGAYLHFLLDKAEDSSIYYRQSEATSIFNRRDADLSIKLAGPLTR